MYNAKQKERYIQQKENTTSVPAGYLRRYFVKAKEFENLFQKDLSSFTVYEILDFYKALNIASLNSLIVLNSHLTLYTDWCLKQNLVADCQNHYVELSVDALSNCINKAALDKAIISREELYKWLDQVPNASDAFVLIALFEGIRGKHFSEITNLNMSHFDENQVTLTSGRKVQVSDRLVNIAQESYDTLVYYAITGKESRKVTLYPEDLIVKNYPNCAGNDTEFKKGRRIYTKLCRILDFLGVGSTITANSLVESGKIDFIKKRSQELGITTKEYIFSEHAGEVEKQFGFPLYQKKAIYWKNYGDYLV